MIGWQPCLGEDLALTVTVTYHPTEEELKPAIRKVLRLEGPTSRRWLAVGLAVALSALFFILNETWTGGFFLVLAVITAFMVAKGNVSSTSYPMSRAFLYR